MEAGLALNDGKITRPTDAFSALLAVSADGTSMEIPNIARFVARGAIDWQHDLGGDWKLEANAYARYVGRRGSASVPTSARSRANISIPA